MAEPTPQSRDDAEDNAVPSIDEIARQEAGTAGPLSPFLARLDVVVTGLICLGAATLAAIMPSLVISGGIVIGRSYATMSASLIPRLVFGTLAVVAAIATVAAFNRLRQTASESPGDEAERFVRAGFVALVILFYALTVTWLGFILSTMIVAAVLAYFLGLRNPLAFIPSAIIVPIVVRFVFERLLLISLPRSRIESIGHLEDVVIQFFVRTLLQ